MKTHLNDYYLLGIFIRIMAGGFSCIIGVMIPVLIGLILFALDVPDWIISPLMYGGMAIFGIIFFTAGFERTKFVHKFFH